MPVQLSIQNLTKIYETGEGVKDISIDVEKGQLVTLLGPSGCGKTTVLRSAGGFIEPNSGSIKIGGNEVLHLPPEKRPTAMVFQSYNLWPHMTVFDNLAFSLKLKKVKKQEIKEKVSWALALVRLSGAEKKYPGELSGGQQQRIALARALLLNPEVLLLDEPFSALDAKLRHELREELREIQAQQNLTMLFVTHDQEEALSISDKVVVMNHGNIEQIATPKEIYNNPASLFVAQFIGRMNFLNGQAESNLINAGTLQFPNPGHNNGDVTIAIRPEDVSVAEPFENGLEARVDKVMMLGHYVEVTLHSMLGQIKMFVDSSKIDQFRLDENIKVKFTKIQSFQNSNSAKLEDRSEVYENV
ncbi:ABC transporter ATP-binding protein [Bacillus gobiensis]|uniref:ABC transporter ATP-binding protein n=1 Tax=Bacillus gobiensis TaxID=1441095 RepID=UPI003D19FE36